MGAAENKEKRGGKVNHFSRLTENKQKKHKDYEREGKRKKKKISRKQVNKIWKKEAGKERKKE